MANFCSGVKVRLFGGAAGSMSSSVTSSFWARSIKGVELVKVMVSVLPVSPWREERLRQVSHVSLTDRGLTAGHLAGAVALHAFEAEALEPAPRRSEGLSARHPTEQQGQRDVLLGGQLRHELAELEHEAEAITPQAGAILLSQGIEVLAVEAHLTGVGGEDARQAVEQRGLA